MLPIVLLVGLGLAITAVIIARHNYAVAAPAAEAPPVPDVPAPMPLLLTHAEPPAPDDPFAGGFADFLVRNGLTPNAKTTPAPAADPLALLNGTAVDPATLTELDGTEEALVYIYDAGQPEPQLALADNGDGTQTLTADGKVVAVLRAPGLTAADITLFQRPEGA